MNWTSFLLRRLLYSIFVLVGLSVLIFLIARIVPGDPARMALGARAPEEVVQQLRQQMNLDQPFHIQYFAWLSGVARGDLGESLWTRRPVLEDVMEFLPATMELALFAGVLMAVFGILLGALSARYANSWIDNCVRLLSYMGVVTPAFVFAILFVLIFGYAWPIFPTVGRLSESIVAPPTVTGFVTIDSLLAGNLEALGDALRHLVLPALALAMGGLAQEARITRSAMTDNLNKDYIAAEIAQGIPDRVIMLKYLLKPSLIPTVSVLGLDFASLLANAFLVELIFNWPGISRYGINVMLHKDLNAISAVIMIMGLLFVVVNIITDIVVAFLDPRIRLGMHKG